MTSGIEPGLGQIEQGTVLRGPVWPEPVRVLIATPSGDGDALRLQVVGLTTSTFYDLTLTREQLRALDRDDAGAAHALDADPRLFRLATEALRTSLAHAFDPQFAVSVSQVDPLPHQLEAVYRHMLPLPRIRFLLADDPGAGKTIMAGLLMRELMQRQGVRRVLVLCPKALTDQWRREMAEKFNARFTLLTGGVIAGAYGQNVWAENPLAVASVDLAIQPHVLPSLEQAEWDLVIFDEAHKLSAYRYGTRISKTQRYQLAEKLAGRTKHLLLMTATPHKGDDENFRLLLALLDPAVFATQRGMRRALEASTTSASNGNGNGGSPYFLRRMKEAMKGFDGAPLFLPRSVDTVQYELEPHEQALYEAVTEYVSTGLRQAESAANRNVSLALTVLQRRLASSLYAITRSLERRRDRLAGELELARATGRLPRREGAPAIAEPDPDGDDAPELDDEEEATLSAASNARTAEELAAEIVLLDDLLAQARAALHAPRHERKLAEFLRVVDDETVRDRDEKVLVFTEHRDTLTWITQQLQARGFRVCNIHGGMNLEDRIAAEREFRGPAQFLVATDAAGEGINLQFCRVMVNWDLPWNPNRLEQRMGRIHRYGQQYEVSVYNLVANTTREGQVLIRLMDKLDRMREAIGHDQVYDVIAGVLDGSQIRLDTLIREAILQRRSLDDILREFDTVDSDAAKAAAREALGEALATRHIDLGAILGEQRDSKERRLTPEYVERFFVDALRYLGGRVSAGNDRDWRIEHVPAEVRASARNRRLGEAGLERLVTFRKERLRADPPAELLAPDQPLFDAVVDELLADGRGALLRGSAFIDKETTEPYIVWLLEAGVRNGDGDLVHKRLLGLRQRGSAFEPVEPGVILDLEPASSAPHVPDGLRALLDADAAVNAAASAYTSQYLREVSAEQDRQAAIVHRALQQSVHEELIRLQDQLDRQGQDAARGKDMRIAMLNTNQQIDALNAQFQARQAELQRRRTCTIETPRVVGVAAVLAPPAPRAWGDDDHTLDRQAIELAAMQVVMEYERAAGRTPTDVSKRGVGYDIRSEGPGDEATREVRYIEVKGHAATGDVTLYYTEWQTANRMRGEFYIYDVAYALSDPRLRIVRDPVGKGIRPVEKVVEYAIRREQLLAVAEGMG